VGERPERFLAVSHDLLSKSRAAADRGISAAILWTNGEKPCLADQTFGTVRRLRKFTYLRSFRILFSP